MIGTRPAPTSSTSVSSASSAQVTSEKPMRDQSEPPTVARFLNWVPTMSRTASERMPPVASARPSWRSSWPSVTMAPMRNPSSVSSIRSSPQRERSMPSGTVRSASRSHIMPPMTTAALSERSRS